MSPSIGGNLSTSGSKESSPWDSMLENLDTVLSQPNRQVDIDDLWRVLERYESDPVDWAKYAYYDALKYKRNLVAEYENYNIMIICWGAGSKSTIHDHSGAHCFMKVLEGDIIESRFAWPEENHLARGVDRKMRLIEENEMSTNDVLYINDKVGLHQVENPSRTKTAASLHVYIPPYRKCKAFDQSTGAARVCKLSFYSERGQVIGEDEKNPWVD